MGGKTVQENKDSDSYRGFNLNIVNKPYGPGTYGSTKGRPPKKNKKKMKKKGKKK